MSSLEDVENRIRAGEALTRPELEQLLASPDLVGLGLLGEAARKARRGETVTYGRVFVLENGTPVSDAPAAGEMRLVRTPESVDDARQRVRAAAPHAGRSVLTGFSLADLLDLVGHDHLALADLSRDLRSDGLEAVAETPLDRLGDTENLVEVVRAVTHGGLGVWRATVDRATLAERLELVERAATLQRETGVLRAFAPLPRIDPADTPATGYDDVRTVVAARLMCPHIPAIQVDWPLYGPKLAQVAIAYGADDIDGISVVDALNLGARRSPREDIERQIRSAFAVPVERDGRYGLRS